MAARCCFASKITIANAVINDFAGRGFEHLEETCWRQSATEVGFKSDTYGDVDAIELDVSLLATAKIRVEGTIDAYVKVGDPLKGNPFVHCPTFSWELTGAELLAQGRLTKDLPGIEMLLAFERMSDVPAPRDVSGRFTLDAKNGPHGHRPVYVFARQVDDAKIWTSALFMRFE